MEEGLIATDLVTEWGISQQIWDKNLALIPGFCATSKET